MTAQNTQQNARNFLDLPSEIRHRIYITAGLVVGTVIRLMPNGDYCRYVGFRLPRESPGFTYNLLQTCKAINSEVMTLICSYNALVVVHQYVDAGLKFLRRLSPQQCSALTDLFVQLHLEAPVLGDCFDIDADPLRTLPPDAALVASWQAVAKHILSHTRPRTLSLRLFCDTGDGDTTLAVLQPLRDFPGVLRDCELQLHHQQGNTSARAIAWDTSILAKAPDPHLWDRFFRFFDLPIEIRRCILEYTDLVTPYKEVYWSASRGFRIATALIRCEHLNCDTHLHRGCRFLNCGPDYSETGYICYRRRTGYSPHCQCWAAPRALFLANKSLYQEALQVLYSCNRVIVVPSEGLRSCLRPDDTASRLDASRFITRHMWPDVLHNLRTIEFVFPAIEPASFPVSGEPYYIDFCFAIEHLKAHADISKLAIVLSITSPRSVTNGDRGSIHREITKPRTDKAIVLQTYAQLLQCLGTLRCMRRFVVHLEWAWHWRVKHPRVGSQYHNILDAEVNRTETWLEKLVMGDGYNNEAAEKIVEQPSIWLYAIWNTLEHVGWPDVPQQQLFRDI